MIVCSHCLHHNPDAATYCEACGTELPEVSSCPNCGAPIQANGRFCGECGFKLQMSTYPRLEPLDAKGTNSDIFLPEPFPPEPMLEVRGASTSRGGERPETTPDSSYTTTAETPEALEPLSQVHEEMNTTAERTQIQMQAPRLLHVQSNTLIDLPQNQSTIYIGKPNERIPPDINVSVFSSAEVVSRIHAAIHVEEGYFFVEDLSSANGTYLNNMLLTPNTRYRLCGGDQVNLGKGELVTFILK